MSLLQRKISEARSPEEIAAARTLAILSDVPHEAARPDYFSTDPASGYDAAQIALRLFEGGFLDEFSAFLEEKKLSPNIVLANGLTLLQNSLMQFPADNARLECLLNLGANPNLFMRKVEDKGFSKNKYPAALHPLNYAFANCPESTSPEICYTLRKYGASIEGLKYRLEVDPDLAVPDDMAKAQLRRNLIATAPDADCTAIVRNDVDLSVMQREMANVEVQLAAAGFQVVSYVPPVKKIEPPKAVFSAAQIGQPIENKGIYLGSWQPKDRDGKSLGKTYSVFAAPEDLTGRNSPKVLMKFKEAAKEVAALRNWHGHDGGDFANDTALYTALANSSYQGQWFIPTRDLVIGSDVDGNKVQEDTLYKHKDTGAFAGTFTTESNGADDAHWYWSSTENRDAPDSAWGVRFSDGAGGWGRKDDRRLSCRPVRVEELII